MFGGLGVPELLIILVIVLVIFGAGKLPQIGGNLGRAIKNFKTGVKEEELTDKEENTEKIESKAEEN
ncbi:twin-arginine translocase TatA/TatE family subunit [Dethiosulfatarculus sandiegensis]|uniref:Sec-independent protein translocase protein TatA n=1 Tax=Dethiosulfatarculus sandiegensis TaxID=1429043 RepID=A0A0D2J3B5_9BACT|nr:twin-arginine translocase TatA/TatE family subunit [Dethiosulfatarculus sandiegensis]KIX12694.1 preprotein translocase subunit TatA [Dethiosulfatarculus sandiegensis]